MSLINQMLKDLEQRGAGSTDAEEIITTSLNAIQNPSVAMPHSHRPYHAKHGVPYLKISGLMVLLAGGAYLWMQSQPALSESAAHIHALSSSEKLAVVNAAPTIIPTAEPVLSEQIMAATPAPLFESTLKYTPIAAENQPSKVNSLAESNVGKVHEKAIVVANLMPAELLANNQTNVAVQTKPIESAKPIEYSEVTNIQSVPDKVATNVKPVTHSNPNNNGVGKQMSAEQKSANAYRQALSNLQQGRIAEAQGNLTQALEANPYNQDARQTLAGLLLDNNRKDEAKTTLAAGLAITPEQTNFRIALARLQVELGDKTGALSTLEQGLSYANNNADYQSFLATLLQRANRHQEAISHYNTALSINSGAVNSLIGLGISQQALGKFENAQEAYTRAQTFASLSPDLTQFIDQQLKEINLHLQNSTQK